MKNPTGPLALFAALCLAPAMAVATPPGPPPGGPPPGGAHGHGPGDFGPPHGAWGHGRGKAAHKARYEATRRVTVQMLRTDVGLAPDKIGAVTAQMDAFRPRREKLKRRIRRHGKALRLLVRSGSEDQKAYKRAIDGMLAAQRAERALRDEMFRAFRKHMTPKQQAKMLTTLPKLHKRVRAELRRTNKARMRAEAMRLLNQKD